MTFDETGFEDERRSCNEARVVAMGMLARREHSRRELVGKLASRQFSEETIKQVLDALTDEGLQSDARFAEAFVRSRAEKGQGPVRIQTELRERGIDGVLIEAVLDPRDPEWRARMESVRCKRFGPGAPADWPERAKQMRFLQYRGFGAEMVRRMLDDSEN